MNRFTLLIYLSLLMLTSCVKQTGHDINRVMIELNITGKYVDLFKDKQIEILSDEEIINKQNSTSTMTYLTFSITPEQFRSIIGENTTKRVVLHIRLIPFKSKAPVYKLPLAITLHKSTKNYQQTWGPKKLELKKFIDRDYERSLY